MAASGIGANGIAQRMNEQKAVAQSPTPRDDRLAPVQCGPPPPAPTASARQCICPPGHPSGIPGSRTNGFTMVDALDRWEDGAQRRHPTSWQGSRLPDIGGSNSDSAL